MGWAFSQELTDGRIMGWSYVVFRILLSRDVTVPCFSAREKGAGGKYSSSMKKRLILYIFLLVPFHHRAAHKSNDMIWFDLCFKIKSGKVLPDATVITLKEENNDWLLKYNVCIFSKTKQNKTLLFQRTKSSQVLKRHKSYQCCLVKSQVELISQTLRNVKGRKSLNSQESSKSIVCTFYS